MFISENIEAILKSVVLDSDDDKRLAKCTLHIAPLTYELAKELSPAIAEDLFRPNGMREFVPRLEVKHMSFNEEVKPQRMEFRPEPSVVVPGGHFIGVKVTELYAFRGKKSDEFTLQLGIRFEIGERAIASKFLIDHYKQTVFLTFTPMQRGLGLEKPQEAPLGKFVNDRARHRQIGFGDVRRKGATP